MHDSLPTFELVPPGSLRDRLNAEVLLGRKTATSRLAVMDEMAGAVVEAPGTRMRLLDSAQQTAAVIEIERILVAPFGEIGSEVSAAEGAWMVDPADWRVAHTRYWNSQLPEIRAYLADEAWALTAETPVVVRFFRLIKENS